MKKINLFVLLSLLILTMVSLSGCVSSNALKAQNPSQLDSLLVRYSDRFDNTKIGMGVSDFLQVWKGAYKNSESTGSVTYGSQFQNNKSANKYAFIHA